VTEGLITAGEGLPWESAELGQAHSLQFAHLQAVGKLNAAASRIYPLRDRAAREAKAVVRALDSGAARNRSGA